MEIAISDFDSLEIVSIVRVIKNAIFTSRYNAARLANKELLTLYYNVGEFISVNSRNAKWGTGAIVAISKLLQKELPGLRGFSEAGIKRMRTFYEGWNRSVANRPMALDDFGGNPNDAMIQSRPMPLDDFSEQEIEWFFVSVFLITMKY